MTLALALLADAYEALPHTPTAPHVRDAYAALSAELWQQFEALALSVTFEDTDPYASSRELFADCERGQLRIYRHGATLPDGHPFAALAPNGETFNSVFRAVHDAIAHYPARNTFSIQGECRAFGAHAATLSARAIPALVTETIGQTAYYARYRTFAPQRAALLPAGLIRMALEIHG